MAYIYPKNRSAQPRRWQQRGTFIGLVLLSALAAFELFNFATTDYALSTLLGGIAVLGVSWSSVLAVAFCAIDFAGLARLFTPEQGPNEPKEVWFLLGAWFLGASMNAVMTWWAVANALVGHPFGNELISRDQLLAIVPVFVAALVWLTRILIIGTFGVAGERLFSQGQRSSKRPAASPARVTKSQRPSLRTAQTTSSSSRRAPSYSSSPRPAQPEPEEDELTYEDINAPPAAASNTSYGNKYRRSRTGRPGYSYGYSTRAYSLTQPYAAHSDDGGENQPFYR